MKLSGRSVALWLGGLVVLAAFGAWLATATEWVTSDVWDPPQGEAASDPYFLLKRLALKVGAKVETRHQLDPLPPEGATLLLEASHWDFLPERKAALRTWVERGGHLVAYRLVADDKALTDWVPATFETPPERCMAPAASAPASGASAVPQAASAPASAPTSVADDDDEALDDEDEDDDADAASVAPAAEAASAPAASASSITPQGTAPSRRREARCSLLSEPPGPAGWFGAPRSYKVCERSTQGLQAKTEPLWSVVDSKGVKALRVAVGQGTATLSSHWQAPTGADLQEDDQALLWAAIVQLHPGQLIWIVDDEHHPGLFATLWRVAPAACVLALLALLLTLWRWGIRFAPLRAADVLARRSMAEQVRGTAAYLLRHGPAALHRAQWRALDEAAHTHLHGWRRLPPERRAAVLARHAELPPAELDKAFDAAATREPAAMGRALALMEAARRRIAELGREAAAASRTPPPPSA
jgi:hypothetical protein